MAPGDERTESVLVERVSTDCYRIASTPGFVENLAAGDFIGLDPTLPEGYRLLISRGRNLAIRFVLASDAPLSARAVAQQFLDRQFSSLKGQLDGHMGTRGLVYTVPLAAGFDAVDGVMGRAVERFSGSTWWYGNVYGKDDQPLNWWL